MTVETATYISDLNASNPAGGANVSQGDDHIRLVKSTIKATFPNVAGALTATHTQLNYVTGVTSAIQTQINTLSTQVGEPYVWTNKSANYTAAAGDAILADTSGGVWTLTLPPSPTVGNTVRVVDVSGSFDTNNLQIGRNGQKINGLSENMYVDIAEVSVMFVYTGTTYGWRAV